MWLSQPSIQQYSGDYRWTQHNRCIPYNSYYNCDLQNYFCKCFAMHVGLSYPSLTWPDHFFPCVGLGGKGSGYPSIEILCNRIARNWQVLMSCKDLLMNNDQQMTPTMAPIVMALGFYMHLKSKHNQFRRLAVDCWEAKALQQTGKPDLDSLSSVVKSLHGLCYGSICKNSGLLVVDSILTQLF